MPTLLLVPSLVSRLSEAKVQGHLEKPLWKVELKDAIVAGGYLVPKVLAKRGLVYVRFV
jgi:hypothetical protein